MFTHLQKLSQLNFSYQDDLMEIFLLNKKSILCIISVVYRSIFSCFMYCIYKESNEKSKIKKSLYTQKNPTNMERYRKT